MFLFLAVDGAAVSFSSIPVPCFSHVYSYGILLSLTELLLHLVRCGAFCNNVSSFGCSSMVVFLGL